MEQKLGEARNKRETLKARAATAKSSKQIQEVRTACDMAVLSEWWCLC